MANGSITRGMAAEHGDRQIAKAHIFGQHGQQRLDDARAETVADHHAVDVARIERARRALDAERADHADPLADRDRQRRIGAAAAGDQHARFVERIARRQFRQLLAARRQACAMRRSTVPCSVRMRSAVREPPHQPLGRRVGGDRQRIRHDGDAVVAGARDDRHEEAAAACARSASAAAAPRARAGSGQARRGRPLPARPRQAPPARRPRSFR